MSTIKVNKITPLGGIASGQGGGIIQTIHADTTTEVSNDTNSYDDTGLSANITPTSSTNKILIIVCQHLRAVGSGTTVGMGYRVMRGSTIIEEGRPSDSTGPFQYYFAGGFGSSPNFYLTHSFQMLDDPGVTTQLTYKTRFRHYNGGTIFAQNAGGTLNGKSRIILHEISGD